MGWLKRHWRMLLGAAGLAEPLWRGLKWLIGRGGDIDFVISRIQDPAWVGDVLRFLNELPGYASLALLFLGLGLLFWDVRRNRKIAPPPVPVSEKPEAQKPGVADPKTERRRIQVLSVLWEQGLELAQKHITMEEYAQWRKDVTTWGLVTLKYIAIKFSHQDAVNFKTTKYHFRENYIYKVNEEHNGKIIELISSCDKLKEMLSAYRSDWIPITPYEHGEILAQLHSFQTQVLATNRG